MPVVGDSRMPVRARMRGSRALALGIGMKDVGTLRSFERAWICWSFWGD